MYWMEKPASKLFCMKSRVYFWYAVLTDEDKLKKKKFMMKVVIFNLFNKEDGELNGIYTHKMEISKWKKVQNK